MKNLHMFKTLLSLRGNPRVCIYTEPLFTIPFSLFIPYASLYMLALGVTKIQLGHIITIGMVSQVIFSLLGGVITDKLGRKKTTFIFDMMSWGIPTFIWAISSSYIYFAVAAAINGVLRITANSWTCLLVEDAEENKLVSIFSWIQISGLAAAFFSPLTGLFVKNYDLIPTIRVIYFIAFVSMMIKFIILNVVSNETKTGLKRMEETKNSSYIELLSGYGKIFKLILTNPKTIFTVAILVVLNIVVTINGTFWSVIVTERVHIPNEYIGVLTAIKSIFMLFMFLVIIPKLNINRFKMPMLFGFLLLFISQCVIITTPQNQFFLIVGSIILEALSFSLINPLMDSLQVVMVDKAERARIMGIVYTVVILITAPFGSIAGYLSNIDLRLPFVLNLILIAIGFILVFTTIHQDKMTNMTARGDDI